MKLTLLGTALICLAFITKVDETNGEFEGAINFKVEFEIKTNKIDKSDLENFYGVKKEYLFKKGMYKWITKKGDLEFEVFNYELDSLHTIAKKSGNDTLYFHDFTKATDSIVSVDSVDVIEICGLKCQGIQFNMTNDRKIQITRTLYFPINNLMYSKNYYGKQKSMCNNYIYEYGGSIPLKLVLGMKGVPYKMIYTATKITNRTIKSKEFVVDADQPKKYR